MALLYPHYIGKFIIPTDLIFWWVLYGIATYPPWTQWHPRTLDRYGSPGWRCDAHSGRLPCNAAGCSRGSVGRVWRDDHLGLAGHRCYQHGARRCEARDRDLGISRAEVDFTMIYQTFLSWIRKLDGKLVTHYRWFLLIVLKYMWFLMFAKRLRFFPWGAGGIPIPSPSLVTEVPLCQRPATSHKRCALHQDAQRRSARGSCNVSSCTRTHWGTVSGLTMSYLSELSEVEGKTWGKPEVLYATL